MNICFVENFSESNPDALIGALIARGHKVTPNCTEDTDVIFCGSITRMMTALQHKMDYPHIPLVTYCWDYYKWAHDGKHNLNWGKYGELLRRSKLIMVPSSTQQLRLKELLGLDSVVVKTAITVKDHKTRDGRYVLDPVRYYEHDPNCYWVRDACAELDIPFIHSEHQYTREEFEKLIAECTFMTCGYVEASTGGLSLMEGLWNGKPSLVSNSPYMGAKDYLGEFGNYFDYEDYDDLKRKLLEMFDNPPEIDVKLSQRYISQNFSPESMAKSVEEHLCELKNS